MTDYGNHTDSASAAKPQLQHCIVLTGNEILLVQEAADKIRQQAVAVGCTERSSLVMDARSDWQALLAESQNVSLFGDLKFLEISLPTGKPGTAGGKALSTLANLLAEQKLPDIYMLLKLPALDRTSRQAKWVKELQATATWHEIPAINRRQLPGWIRQRLQLQQQNADETTIEWLCDKVEGNLLAANQEIQKLALIYPAGMLTVEQVQSAVLNVARYNPYDLRDAMLAGNAKRALDILAGLQAEGESLVLVLWAAGEEIRLINRLAWSAGDFSTNARKMRIFGHREQVLRSVIQRTRPEFWARALRHAHEIDRLIKGVPVNGSLANAWDELSRLIMRVATAITRK